MRFAALSWRARTDAQSHHEERAHGGGYACTHLHLFSFVGVRFTEERKEHGRSCSALEQFLDAYCHALLSPESTAITNQLGYRRWSEGRRAKAQGAEGSYTGSPATSTTSQDHYCLRKRSACHGYHPLVSLLFVTKRKAHLAN